MQQRSTPQRITPSSHTIVPSMCSAVRRECATRNRGGAGSVLELELRTCNVAICILSDRLNLVSPAICHASASKSIAVSSPSTTLTIPPTLPTPSLMPTPKPPRLRLLRLRRRTLFPLACARLSHPQSFRVRRSAQSATSARPRRVPSAI